MQRTAHTADATHNHINHAQPQRQTTTSKRSDFPQAALTSSTERQRVSRWMGPASAGGKSKRKTPHVQPPHAGARANEGGDAVEGVNRCERGEGERESVPFVFCLCPLCLAAQQLHSSPSSCQTKQRARLENEKGRRPAPRRRVVAPRGRALAGPRVTLRAAFRTRQRRG